MDPRAEYAAHYRLKIALSSRERRRPPLIGIEVMKRFGTAVWRGDFKNGKGVISTESGALKDFPYGFSSRFEEALGTNPEELLGAAHAGAPLPWLYR